MLLYSVWAIRHHSSIREADAVTRQYLLEITRMLLLRNLLLLYDLYRFRASKLFLLLLLLCFLSHFYCLLKLFFQILDSK